MDDETISQCSIITFSQISPVDSNEKELLDLYEKLSRKRCARTFLARKYSNSIQSQEKEIEALRAKLTEAQKRLTGKGELEKQQELKKEHEAKIKYKYLKTVIAKEKIKTEEKTKQLLAVREKVQQACKECDDIMEEGSQHFKQLMKQDPDPLVTKHRELKKEFFEMVDCLKLLFSDPKNQDLISNGCDELMIQIDQYLSRAKDREKCSKNPYFFDETKVVKNLMQSRRPFSDELEKIRIGFKKGEKTSKLKDESDQMQSEGIDLDKVMPTIERRNVKSSVDDQFPNRNLADAAISDQTADNPTLGNYSYKSSSGKIMKIPMSKNASQDKIVQCLDSVALCNVETSTASMTQHYHNVENYLSKVKHDFGNEENNEQNISRGKKTPNPSVYTLPMFTTKPESDAKEIEQEFPMLMFKKPLCDQTNIMESPTYRSKREGSDKGCRQMIYEMQAQAMEMNKGLMDPEDSMVDDFQPMIKKKPGSNSHTSLVESVHSTHKSLNNSKIHNKHVQSYGPEAPISSKYYIPCSISNYASHGRYSTTEISHGLLMEHASTAAADYKEHAAEFLHGKLPYDAESLFKFKQQLEDWKTCASEPHGPPPEHLLVMPRFNSECQLPEKICSPKSPIPLNRSDICTVNFPDNLASSPMIQDFANVKGIWNVDSSAKPSAICPSITVSKSKKHARKIQTLPYQSASRGMASHHKEDKKSGNFIYTSHALKVEEKNLQCSYFDSTNDHGRNVDLDEEGLEKSVPCPWESNTPTSDSNICFSDIWEHPDLYFQEKYEEGTGPKMPKVHHQIIKDCENNDLTSKPKDEDSALLLQTSTEHNSTLKSLNYSKSFTEPGTNITADVKLNSPCVIGQNLKSPKPCSTYDTKNNFLRKLHPVMSIPDEDTIGLGNKVDINRAHGDQCKGQSFRLPGNASKEFEREAIGRRIVEIEQEVHTSPVHIKKSDFHIAPTEFFQSKLSDNKGINEEKFSKYRTSVHEGLQDSIEAVDNMKNYAQLSSMRNRYDNVNRITANDPDVLQILLSCKKQNVMNSDVDRNTCPLESGGLLNNFDRSKCSAERESYSLGYNLAQNSKPAQICLSLDSDRNSESSHPIEKDSIAAPKILPNQANSLVDNTVTTTLLSNSRMSAVKKMHEHLKKTHSVFSETIVLSSDDELSNSSQRIRKSRVAHPMFNIKEVSANIVHSTMKEKVTSKPPLQGKEQNYSRKMMSTDFLQFMYPCFDNQRETGKKDPQEDMANASCHNATSVDDTGINVMDVMQNIQPCTSKQNVSEITDSLHGQLNECKPVPQSKEEVSKSISNFPDNDQRLKLNSPFGMSQQFLSNDFSKNVCTPGDDYLMQLMGDYDSQVCPLSITSDNFNPVYNYSAESAVKDIVSPLNARNSPKKSDTYIPFDFEKYMKPPSDSPESPPTSFQMTSRNMFSSRNAVPRFASKKKEDTKTSGFQTIEEIMKESRSVVSSPIIGKHLDEVGIFPTRQGPKEMSMHSGFLHGFSKQK